MGRKLSGQGKQVRLCLAILICHAAWACTLHTPEKRVIIDPKEAQIREHLARGKMLLSRGNYGNALVENEKALSLMGNRESADEPLFMIGLIAAHPANPAKDYGKSIITFRRLIKEHPQSPLIEQAKTLLGLLQEHDRLNRTVERLTTTIDDLKAVDIGIDQRKRDKGK